jgi:ABC-type multidrug transport system ATPase subunit
MSRLAITEVRKLLGGRWVLDGIDIVWDRAGTLVIQGENGTGKSTLLRILAGVIPADAGEVIIAGHRLSTDRLAALRHLGYAPEIAELPAHLRVAELIALVSALKGSARPPPALVERLGVTAILGQRLGSLSLGQRRRACLLAALTGDPALLVLDEPTNGLDREGITLLIDLLIERARDGFAAIVATHDRAFIERVATEKVTLAGGRAAREA